MSDEEMYAGQCFCGAVRFELRGMPAATGMCHCDSCRHWSGGPVNAFTLWEPDALQITAGAENVRSFNKTSKSHRKWCAICGGHLFTDHPVMGLVDVYAALIPTLAFEPAMHVYYRETVLPIRDGKPKFADLPIEVGGSGAQLIE